MMRLVLICAAIGLVTVTAGVALSVAHTSRVSFPTAAPQTYATVSAFGRTPEAPERGTFAPRPGAPVQAAPHADRLMTPHQDMPATVTQNAVPLAHFGTIRAPRAGLRPRARDDAPQIALRPTPPVIVAEHVRAAATTPHEGALQTYMAPLPLPMVDTPAPAPRRIPANLPPEYLLGVYR